MVEKLRSRAFATQHKHGCLRALAKRGALSRMLFQNSRCRIHDDVPAFGKCRRLGRSYSWGDCLDSAVCNPGQILSREAAKSLSNQGLPRLLDGYSTPASAA